MTGEDGTADRDGHGMGDERDASGRRPARPEEPMRGHEHADGSPPTEDRPQSNAPLPDRTQPHDDVPEQTGTRAADAAPGRGPAWGDRDASGEEPPRDGGRGSGEVAPHDGRHGSGRESAREGRGVSGEELSWDARRASGEMAPHDGRRVSGWEPGRRGPGVSRPAAVRGGRDAPEPESSYDGAVLGALLGAAIRRDKSDGEAERRAVAAFRVARDAGAHRARTRRRDDWRPRERRWNGRSLKTTLSVLLASLTLGGVAYAAIGSVGGGPAKDTAGDKDVRPSVSASTPAESHSSARSSASGAAPADRPPTAKDTLAHCRAYEKLRGRGKALDSAAFQRLVAAAGGEANVSAYCAARTGTATADASDTNDAKPGRQNAKESGANNADKNKSKKQ